MLTDLNTDQTSIQTHTDTFVILDRFEWQGVNVKILCTHKSLDSEISYPSRINPEPFKRTLQRKPFTEFGTLDSLFTKKWTISKNTAFSIENYYKLNRSTYFIDDLFLKVV